MRLPVVAAVLGVLVLGPAPLASPAEAASGSPVQIFVDDPTTGEVVRNKVHIAPIRGSAVAEGEMPADFDVMMAIDISDSTNDASGVGYTVVSVSMLPARMLWGIVMSCSAERSSRPPWLCSIGKPAGTTSIRRVTSSA